jgi:hypothetical protein
MNSVRRTIYTLGETGFSENLKGKVCGSRESLTTHSTGARVSLIFIENSDGLCGWSRPVNSGVMSPLLAKSEMIPAALLLCCHDVEWIMRKVG